jgi:hypothetical protein
MGEAGETHPFSSAFNASASTMLTVEYQRWRDSRRNSLRVEMRPAPTSTRAALELARKG